MKSRTRSLINYFFKRYQKPLTQSIQQLFGKLQEQTDYVIRKRPEKLVTNGNYMFTMNMQIVGIYGIQLYRIIKQDCLHIQ